MFGKEGIHGQSEEGGDYRRQATEKRDLLCGHLFPVEHQHKNQAEKQKQQ